ncbi:MAG: hypothetical protein M1839_001673 [Geoglossum umbratile]|nr:MAG: hypothetical protein M1839_001673 [Geoglossum umbratile]
MKWPFGSKKGKERSSQPGGYSPTTTADQPAEKLRDVSQAGTARPTVVQQPVQIIQSSPSAPGRIDKYGLFLLNPQTSHSDGMEAEETFLLDIVALHGITGDAYNTWTHENGKFWLQDFDQKRRIIFICHSMGGIVVKKALIIALIDKIYDNIRASVTAILFLGTPHRGSEETGFPLVLTSIANMALAGTSRFIGSARSDLIKSLEKDSKMLKDISTDFRDQTRDIKVASFIEQNCTPPAKNRIVDDISGIMGVAGERIIPMPNCDHKSICRFGGETSGGYKSRYSKDKTDAVSDRILFSLVITEPTSEDLSCLHSLVYPEMTYRRQEVDRAYPNTCGWILQHESYTKWMSGECGLLWVKGSPGTGKSTLMAYVYRALQAVPAHERHMDLDFFFHGRGTMLQKTPIGMFRSLLHQLFTRAHSVRGPIRKAFQEKRGFREPGKDWEWQLKELQDLFFNAMIYIAKTRAVTVFVDALDEAGFKAAEELVTYFHILNDRLIASNSVRICISCRHYPVVARIPGLEIYVEKESHGDISTFVHDQLNSKVLVWEEDPTSIDACRVLEAAIVKKASGVFQWARLVVPMVSKRLNDGESLEAIHQMLARVPEEVGTVYEHILKNVIEASYLARTLHLMQWICLAERPLSLIELRFAMASDDTHIHPPQLRCKDATDFVETDARMEKLAISLSGGLAEVKHHGGGTTVQFIHQSVNDFLLSGGLNFLASASAGALLGGGSEHLMGLSSGEIVGRSQHRLSRSCINYLKLEEVLRQW